MEHLTRGGKSGALIPMYISLTIPTPDGDIQRNWLTPLCAAATVMIYGRAKMAGTEGARIVAKILRDALDLSLYQVEQYRENITIYPPRETKCIWCGRDYIQRGTARPSSFDGHRGPMGGCCGPANPDLYVAWMTGRVG